MGCHRSTVIKHLRSGPRLAPTAPVVVFEAASSGDFLIAQRRFPQWRDARRACAALPHRLRAADGAAPHSDPATAPGRGLLRRLAADSSPQVRTTVAANPRTEAAVLVALASDPETVVATAAAGNPTVPAPILGRLAYHGDTVGPEPVARNSACPSSLLARLVSRQDASVRTLTAAASHPNCPPRLAAMLASSPHLEVRRALGRNPRTPAWLLERLAVDPDARTRRYAVMHRSCPVGAVVGAARADDALSRLLIIRDDCPAEVFLLHAARDTNDARMRRAALHPGCPPAALDVIARRGGQWARAAAAARIDCPNAALRRLAEDARQSVRWHVAANPSCPPATVELLSRDRDSDVRAAAAANGRLPAAALERLADDPDERTASTAALAARVAADADAALESAIEEPLSVAAVAGLGGCPNDVLKRLADHDMQTVRVAVARNPNCSPETLERLTDDLDPLVSGAAAQHPHCPPTAARRVLEGLDPESESAALLRKRLLVADRDITASTMMSTTG